MSVVVAGQDTMWYDQAGSVPRRPASNVKLVLSMALLDAFGQQATLPTQLMADAAPVRGVVRGNLWLVGAGDPTTDRFDLRRLVGRLVAAGVTAVRGDIVAATTPFRRDWFAPGWRQSYPAEQVARPTALTFVGNVAASGRHVADPELRASRALRGILARQGVSLRGSAVTGPAPSSLQALVTYRTPLMQLVTGMDYWSLNFSAEVLGKALAYARRGIGSISAAANAICAYEQRRAVRARCLDSSGLSRRNRQTAAGIVELLVDARAQPWGLALRRALPPSGRGTLEGRLAGLQVRAKTGSLTGVSALSGWVRSERTGRWLAFSILTDGMDVTTAKSLEDRIVRIVATRARPPAP